MRHCTADELMDVLDGLRDETSLPHLLSCRSCRDELDAARQGLAMARSADVPEPPPFAMAQLSARVSAEVAAAAAEGWSGRWAETRRRWRNRWIGVAVAAVAVTMLLTIPLWPDRQQAPAQMPASATVEHGASRDPVPAEAAAVPEDPSIVWMLELAEGAQLADDGRLADRVREAGWSVTGTTAADAVQSAVDGLSRDEQQEMWRLIQEAMGSSGA